MDIENKNTDKKEKQAKKLFSKTSKSVKELQVQLSKCNDEKDLNNLFNERETIRNNFEKIYFLDIDFALKKDMMSNLWKSVYYKVIDSYRKIIKKTLSSLKKKKKKKTEFADLIKSFTKFLDETIDYFKSFYEKLEKNFKEVPSIDSALYKCLIILGDLERYKKFYNESKEDWNQAIFYYKKALNLSPENGNAHNQLAVIAVHKKDQTEGIYRYIRSLCVDKPFFSSKDNLMHLFDKNRKFLLGIKNSKEGGEDDVKIFSVKFIAALGICFTKTDFDKLDDLKNDISKSLQVLIEKDIISNYLGIKLLIMCIFVCDNAVKNNFDKERRNAIFDFSLSFILTINRAERFLGLIVVYLKWIYGLKSFLIEENEMFKSFWVVIKDILNKYKSLKLMDSYDGSLPEEIEILGFKPLSGLIRGVQNTEMLDQKFFLEKRILLLRDAIKLYFVDESIPIFYDKMNNEYTNKKPTIVEEPKVIIEEKKREIIEEIKDDEDYDESIHEMINSSTIFKETTITSSHLDNEVSKSEDEEILLNPNLNIFNEDYKIKEPFGRSINDSFSGQWKEGEKNVNNEKKESIFDINNFRWDSLKNNGAKKFTNNPFYSFDTPGSKIIERPKNEKGKEEKGVKENILQSPFDWGFIPPNSIFYDKSNKNEDIF